MRQNNCRKLRLRTYKEIKGCDIIRKQNLNKDKTLTNATLKLQHKEAENTDTVEISICQDNVSIWKDI